MRFRRAYVVKKMADKDFGPLLRDCERISYVFQARHDLGVTLMVGLIGEAVEEFDPISDVFVLAGPTTACCLFMGALLLRYEQFPIAVYDKWAYAYRYHVVGSDLDQLRLTNLQDAEVPLFG